MFDKIMNIITAAIIFIVTEVLVVLGIEVGIHDTMTAEFAMVIATIIVTCSSIKIYNSTQN